MSRKIPIAVIKAAEARAQGNSWEATAAASGWPLDQLRLWIRKRTRQWDQAIGRARREARDSACDEAVATLRVQLRDKKTKTKCEAANVVARHFAKGKVRRPCHSARAAKRKETPPEFLDVLATIPEGTKTRIDLHIQAAEAESARSDASVRPKGERSPAQG